MPNIKSAKKRVKVGERNNTRNVSIKSEFRTAIRAAREAIEAGDQAAAKKAIEYVHKLVDKAVQKKVIHHNKGNRIKSRLAKKAKKQFANK